MKVPIQEDQIHPQVPNAPTPNFPGVVPDAYGANVHEAQAGIGKTISGIGENMSSILSAHIQKQNEIKRDEKAYELGQQVDDFYTKKLYGDGEVDYTDPITNKPRKIPAGIMRRSLHDTSGGALEIKQAKADADKILEPYKNNPKVYYKARRYADAHANTAYEKAIVHEADQSDKATKATFINGLDKQIRGALDAATNDEDAMKSYLRPGTGLADSARAVETLTGLDQSEKKANGIGNYILGRVSNEGDTIDAKESLSKFQGEMGKADYDKIMSNIESRSSSNKKHFDLGVAFEETKNSLDLVQRLVQGEPLPSKDELATMRIPVEMKEAINAAKLDYQKQSKHDVKGTKGWEFGPFHGGDKPDRLKDYGHGIDEKKLMTSETSLKEKAAIGYMASILKMTDQKGMVEAISEIIKNKDFSAEDKVNMFKLILQRKTGLPEVAYTNGLDGAPNPSKGTIPLAQKEKDAVVSKMLEKESKLGDDFHEMFSKLNSEISNKNADPNAVYESIMGKYNLRTNGKFFEGASEEGTDAWDRFGTPVTVYKDGRVIRKK